MHAHPSGFTATAPTLCNHAGLALRYMCWRFRRVLGYAIHQTASSPTLGRHKGGDDGEGGNEGPGRERAFNHLSAVASDSLICPVMTLGWACVPRVGQRQGSLVPTSSIHHPPDPPLTAQQEARAV